MFKKLSDSNLPVNTIVSKHFVAAVFLLLTLVTSNDVFAQRGRFPVKRIRAFQKEETGGVNSARDRVRQKKEFHWIYLELWPGKSVEVKYLWINNEATGFRTEKISTPVFHPSSASNGIGKIVIPASNNEALQILKTDETPDTTNTFSSPPALFRRYPVLICYVSEGKTYFLGVYPQQLPKERNQ